MRLPKSIIVRAVGFVGLAFGCAQLYHPELPNPPVTADVALPPEVGAILRRACYDCHSNETKLRWYDEVAPAYWLVSRDVRGGRSRLNFSELASAPANAQKARLYAAVNQVRLGAMPPTQYTAIHRGAVVTQDEIAVLESYLHPASGDRPLTRQPASAASAPPQPVSPPKPRGPIAPAPNGLAFFADYADWKAISTTDRFDNDTLRAILGNDVAMRAIAGGTIEPWPDGAAFAKVAWAQRPGPGGVVSSGEFKQVEFMVKDARKYAATDGWGWGRWLGDGLTPYGGGNAAFVTECTGCHAPMHANDFVFTMPLAARPSSELWNAKAALPTDGLPFPAQSWRVISSGLHPADDTMSTLYGNDAAVAHARSGTAEPYPAGAALARVTWARQPDAHWFGGRIPGDVRSVEIVTSTGAPGTREAFTYQAFEGAPLRVSSAIGETMRSDRIADIAGTVAAAMP